MLFTRNKPEWLYKALPAICLTGGLLTIAGSSQPIARFSGGLLVVAAASMVFMRRRARRLFERPCPDDPAPPLTKNETSTTGRQVDPNVPETGNPAIDRQHRLLAVQAKSLYSASMNGNAASDLELQLLELLDAFDMHVTAEDDAFTRSSGPGLPSRGDGGKAKLRLGEAYLQSYRQGQRPLHTVINGVTQDLVLAHLHESHRTQSAKGKAETQTRQTADAQ